jgi:hypothetical protein
MKTTILRSVYYALMGIWFCTAFMVVDAIGSEKMSASTKQRNDRKIQPVGATPMYQDNDDFYIYNQSSVPVSIHLTNIDKSHYGDYDSPSFTTASSISSDRLTATINPGDKAEIEFRLSNIGKKWSFTMNHTFQGNNWNCTYSQPAADSDTSDQSVAPGGSCSSGANTGYVSKLVYQGTKDFDADSVTIDLLNSIGLSPDSLIGKVIAGIMEKALNKYMLDMDLQYNDYVMVLSDNMNGACCSAQTCNNTTQSDCISLQGVYGGDHTTCDAINNCTGACYYHKTFPPPGKMSCDQVNVNVCTLRPQSYFNGFGTTVCDKGACSRMDKSQPPLPQTYTCSDNTSQSQCNGNACFAVGQNCSQINLNDCSTK